MPIRPATYHDLRSIAETLAAAFYDEGLNVYFFPHRREYPEDYTRAWYQAILPKWWHYDSTWLVSYNGLEDDNTTPKDDRGASDIKGRTLSITGVAQWGRTVTQRGLLERLWRTIDPRRYVGPLISLYFAFDPWRRPNRAVGKPSSAGLQPLRKWDCGRILFPFCQPLYVQPSASRGYWELEILGVHPAQQKCGFAAELIKWGMLQAKEENLPAVVVMAEGLEEFYAGHGFEVLVGYVPNEDLVVREKGQHGELVERRIENPSQQRGIGGGGVAWTRIEANL